MSGYIVKLKKNNKNKLRNRIHFLALFLGKKLQVILTQEVDLTRSLYIFWICPLICAWQCNLIFTI